MATYAIGDVQGCHATLSRLLERIGFDERRDRLWLVGDLVNRGPKNLEVLRRVRALGDRAVVVLGNHDLHLIARALGVTGPKARDTLDDVLAAPDRDSLIGWLRGRPLVHREGDRLLVHAGLHPDWSVGDAERWARTLEAQLQGPDAGALLLGLKRPSATEVGEAATALYVLTRVRTVREGALCLDFDGPPAEAPPGCVPWFDAPGRRSREAQILFGHWSALGLHVTRDAICLDTGCVWGRELTALCLDDGALYAEPTAPEDRR